MIDNRNSCFGSKPKSKDHVCIDTMQILDSCRDKDCFEDVRVYLTEFGQDVIEKTGNIKVKCTKVICVNVQADPIQFNKGFYQITVRVYTKLLLEACLCPGKSQEFEGIAVTEKKVVLYGGEGCVRIFKSTPIDDGFCAEPCDFEEGSNKPTVVVEMVDPMVLSCKVKEKCTCNNCCCCCVEELPKNVCCQINGCLCDHPALPKQLYVTLGFFSVIRIERPGQFVLAAEEYCVPDKECMMADEEDPCAVFAKMAFPTAQFCPSTYPSVPSPGISSGGSMAPGCGCKNK